MGQENNASHVPQIRFFQFESSTLGAFNKSVNLFRGDVNFSQKLFSMPGRPGSPELEADVSIMYQSNLRNDVTTQNLTAPTGILGMGWTLPLEKVEFVPNGAFSSGNRDYRLQSSGINGKLILTKTENGKEYYQLENYEFWIITYDPAEESWEVTMENGITKVYGGNVTQTKQGYKTSRGNSIAWGVRYGNWIGATSLTSNEDPDKTPMQYAREWYLSETRNVWGDVISYEYNGFPRGPDGLIKYVEQFVGDSSGKPYTKAVYLTKITDVFKRTAVFSYKDKEYDTSSPGAAKEYQAAHSYEANTTKPNGFQDVYETKYLDQIIVNDSGGAAIKNLVFEYYPLQNLTDFSTDSYLYGVTFKRYLKSVQRFSPGETSLPGFNFSYYTDRSAGNTNLGALQSVTIPQGAVATYEYIKQELDICKRSVEIKPDRSIIGWGSLIPRVWFGEDFTVATWYNTVNGKLWLGIYTWLGHWKLWNPSDPIIYNEEGGINLESLNTVVSAQSVALTFKDSQNTYLFLYNKDPQQSGNWISYNDDGITHVTFPSTQVTFNAGTNFLVANHEDSANDKFYLSRVTWNWKTREWMTELNVLTVKLKTLFVTGAGEYYLTMAYDPLTDSNDLNLNYLGMDSSGNITWQKGGQQKLSNISPVNNQNQFLAPGVSTAALAVETWDTHSATRYDLYALMWDENYQFLKNPFSETFKTQKNDADQAAVSIIPRVIANSIIASGENLLRYNGSTWLANRNLQVPQPSHQNEYWYAYGNDFTLRTVNTGKYGITVDMLVYNPSDTKEITAWKNTPFPPKPEPTPPPINPKEAYFPTASGQDFFTSGKAVYYRGSSTDWITPGKSPVFTITDQAGQQINTTSLINEGPSFLAYLVPDDIDPKNTKTVVLELQNGHVRDTGIELTGQMYSLDRSSGKAPSGPNIIVTYPGDTPNGDLDKAASLRLYRYAGDAIEGALVHYPVSRLTVTNGFGENSPSTYTFYPASATCDPSGKVVKYYKSALYPGSNKAEGSQFGSTVNYYINGYNDNTEITYYLNGQEVTGQVAYPTLDGYKLSVETRNSQNKVIRKLDYTWDVFTLRNLSPTKKDAQPAQLYGSYTRQRILEQTLDGVKSTTCSNYIPDGFEVPFSGLVISESNSNYNGQGGAETLTKSRIYGYEKYPGLVGLNYLTVVIQTTQLVTPKGKSPIPIGAQANTWKDWGSGKWGKYQSYQWKGGVSCQFPFPPDYSNPDGWFKNDEITAMSDQGMILEMTNVMGAPNSVLYDRSSEYVIAQFQNTSLARDEGDYYGFEAIEQGTGWVLNDAARIITGHSYTGLCSLILNQGGTLSKSYKPGTKQVYVLGYWYQTPLGYTPGTGSGWTITVSVGTNPAAPFQKKFENTDGVWVFDYLTIDLSADAAGDTVTMAVQAANESGDSVIIDNVRMVPNLSNFSAYVYDTSLNLTLAEMGPGTHLERVFYDEFGRRIGTVGPYEDQLNTVYLKYYSREGNAAGFSARDPNSHVRVQALNGGFNQTFLDSNSWKANWNATNAETNWTSGNGQLRHTTSSVSDTLSLKDPGCRGDFFLAFGIEATSHGQPLVLTDTISIGVGSQNSFSWNPSTKTWSFTVGGTSVQPICTWDATPLNWGLLFKEKTVIFYVNGRILLSVVSDSNLSGRLSLVTGKNEFAFYYLALAKGPKTGVVFQDAMGHPRQDQALSGTNAIVSQSVIDAHGQPIVTTKPAPAFFGDIGKDTPLMTYRSSFIHMSAFLSNLNGSGEMTGDVSSYYNGKNGVANDENYPYNRFLRERSPLSRVIEEGVAGKSYAIIDPWTGDPMTRNTVKYAYSNNKTTPVSGVQDLPAGEYHVTTRIDQNGVPSHGIASKANTWLVKATPAGTDGAEGDTGGTNLINRRFVVYDTGGRTVTQRLPNYFDTTVPGNDKFVILKRYDHLNNMVESSTPDNGTMQALYNRAGQVRFQQDAKGAANGYYAYIKYDTLNRVVEKGILTGTWDPSTLQGKVDDPTWPKGLSGQFIQKQLTYVSYLDSVNGLGKLFNVTTYGEDGSGCTVTEDYVYDSFSRLKTVLSKVTDSSGTLNQGKVGYGYTASGSVSRVIYPDEAGIGTVYYSYDDLNRLVGVGKSADHPDKYAAYTYALDGTPASSSLNAGGIAAAFTYHPPGWTASRLGPDPTKGFNEKLPDYYPDGLIQKVSDLLEGSDFNSELDLSAAYNPSGFLTSVEYSQNADWNLSVSAYDPNGNFCTLKSGDKEETYTYNAGTNQTAAVEAGDSEQLTLAYDAKGGVSQVSPSATSSGTALGFTYMKNGFLTTRVDLKSSGETLDIYYGARGRRALKQLSKGGQVKSRKFYLHGVHSHPLMETTNEGTTAYIYGVKGLIAFQKSGALYFVVRDHLGSIRMVYDVNNAAQAAWSYSMFGEKQTVYEAKPNLLTYLFAGQEWDEEIGLYNFQARMYDPRLRRFYFTDPKNQYAGAYVFTGNDPLCMVDPSGMWSIGDLFTEIGEAVISVAEFAAGVALDVLSLGTAADVGGGTLIGAGLSGVSSIIMANAEGKPLSWKQYGESEAIGAVVGTLSAGIGALGDVAADAAVEAAASRGASTALKIGIKIGVKVGVGAIGGSAVGVFDKFLENAMEGEPLGEGLGTEAWVGVVTGVIGSGLSMAGEGLTRDEGFSIRGKQFNLSATRAKVVVSILSGMVGGAADSLIKWDGEGGHFKWLDFVLNVSLGAVEKSWEPFKEEVNERKLIHRDRVRETWDRIRRCIGRLRRLGRHSTYDHLSCLVEFGEEMQVMSELP